MSRAVCMACFSSYATGGWRAVGAPQRCDGCHTTEAAARIFARDVERGKFDRALVSLSALQKLLETAQIRRESAGSTPKGKAPRER